MSNIDPAALSEILRKHKEWLKGKETGARANLTGADLTGANLAHAYLTGADLTGADLTDADLTGANLTGADLTDADLTGANLTGADLTGANLAHAYLTGADLTGARGLAPTMVLLADWGTVSDDLTRDLMRYDAACHPDPTAFDRWAEGGDCPYLAVSVARAAHFRERRYLWSPGPSPRPYDLMVRVLAEKCATPEHKE